MAALLRVGVLRGGAGDELRDRYASKRASNRPPADLDPVLWRALVSIERQTGVAGGRRASPPARLA